MVATLKDVDVTSPRSGVSIVSFRGEHDVTSSQSTAELLDSLLLANHLVIADVSEAKFVDASMLEVLIETDNAARERRTDFRSGSAQNRSSNVCFRSAACWSRSAAPPRWTRRSRIPTSTTASGGSSGSRIAFPQEEPQNLSLRSPCSPNARTTPRLSPKPPS